MARVRGDNLPLEQIRQIWLKANWENIEDIIDQAFQLFDRVKPENREAASSYLSGLVKIHLAWKERFEAGKSLKTPKVPTRTLAEARAHYKDLAGQFPSLKEK